MKIKILAIVLLMLTFSCDSYRSGASKIVGMRGYCVWQKDKTGYGVFYSEDLPLSQNQEYKKCKDLEQCMIQCEQNATHKSRVIEAKK